MWPPNHHHHLYPHRGPPVSQLQPLNPPRPVQVQFSPQKVQDLDTLHQCFPNVEHQALESIYTSVGDNFEKSFQAISEMEKSAQKPAPQISPQQKLAFLKIVFEKLDPFLIEGILQKYNWSVESALDELLDLEEKRSQLEAEARRQLDLQRLAQQQAENQRIWLAQQEIERRNLIAHFRNICPRIDERYIVETLTKCNWDQQAVYYQLAPIETQLLQKEQYENQLREQAQRSAEERWRAEEAARLQNAASNLQPSTLNSMMNGVQNWDQLMNRFEIEAPESNPDVQRDQTFYCDLAKEFWGVEHSVSLQIFESTHWDMKLAYPCLEKYSFEQFKKKLQGNFPSLTDHEIDPVVTKCFPNENKAVQQLNVFSRIQLLEEAISQARMRLDDAVKRQCETNKNFEQQQAKWATQQMEVAKLPPGERSLMESAYQMLQQKETSFFNEMAANHQKEIEKFKQELADALAALAAFKSENSKPKPEAPQLTPDERLKKIEDKIAAHKASRQAEKAQHVEVKKSIIADKLRKQLGEDAFNKFAKAIGDAPGGVVAGWKGPADRQTNSDSVQKVPSSTSIAQPTQTPAPISQITNYTPGGPTGTVPPQNNYTPSPGPTATLPNTYPPSPRSSGSLPSGYPPSPTFTGSSGLPPFPQPGSLPPPGTLGTLPAQQFPPPVLGTLPPPQFSTSGPYPNGYPPAQSTGVPQFPPGFGYPSAQPPTYPAQPGPYQSVPPSGQQANEDRIFSEWFYIADVAHIGFMRMEDAVFLKRSLLPDHVLAEVWRIASVGNDRLDRGQFGLALNLIYLAQQGLPLTIEQINKLRAQKASMIPYIR